MSVTRVRRLPWWTSAGLLAFLPLVGAGCAKAPPDASSARDDGGPPGATLPVGPPSVWAGATSADLFAVDHVPHLDLTVPEEQWTWLQANAKNEEYVAAQATYENRPAGLVGLRFKGSYGTLLNCLDSQNRLICAKLSFKVSFEEYDPDNRFFGLKKVNLHSMIHDPTKLRERLSYDLFRAVGLHGPRSTWATVRVNGRDFGLFSLVEEIDGRFTDDRWPGEGDGNLYKEAWPTTTPISQYAQKLETNRPTAKHDVLLAFANEMRTLNPGPELTAALGKWMDLPSLYRYMAVDDAVVNCDGVTAFYAPGMTGAAWGNHNFFLYQEQNRPRFWLIPWDMDATLSTCSAFTAVPRWNVVPASCDRNYSVWGGSWVKPAGCDSLFRAMAQDSAAYGKAVDELLAGPFSLEVMSERITHWAAFIRGSVATDPTLGGVATWDAAVENLKAFVPVLRARLTAMRSSLPSAQ